MEREIETETVGDVFFLIRIFVIVSVVGIIVFAQG